MIKAGKFKTPTALTLGVSAWCRSTANHHFRESSAHYDDRWHFIVASLVLGQHCVLKPETLYDSALPAPLASFAAIVVELFRSPRAKL